MRPPAGVPPEQLTLETTGYCKCKECTGWRRNILGQTIYKSGSSRGQRKQVGITSSGAKAHLGTIAADTSIYPYGTVIYVPGYGYGRVEDTGGAIKGEHIDLFFRSHEDALIWGRRMKDVKVWRRQAVQY